MSIVLSIVVPAYNEQDRIRPTLEQYLDVFRSSHKDRFEVVIVLNGCRDNTRSVVESIASTAPEVRIIEFLEPLGKGGAIRVGLDAAEGAVLAYVDADNMVQALETEKLITALEHHDVAIADRFGGEQINGKQPSLRRLISLGSRLWVRWFLRLPYSDTQCGAKVFRAAAWNTLASRVIEDGWAFDLDVLAHANRLNLSVAEIPVRWAHISEGSKVKPWKDVPSTLLATFRIKRRAQR